MIKKGFKEYANGISLYKEDINFNLIKTLKGKDYLFSFKRSKLNPYNYDLIISCKDFEKAEEISLIVYIIISTFTYYPLELDNFNLTEYSKDNDTGVYFSCPNIFRCLIIAKDFINKRNKNYLFATTKLYFSYLMNYNHLIEIDPYHSENLKTPTIKKTFSLVKISKMQIALSLAYDAIEEFGLRTEKKGDESEIELKEKVSKLKINPKTEILWDYRNRKKDIEKRERKQAEKEKHFSFDGIKKQKARPIKLDIITSIQRARGLRSLCHHNSSSKKDKKINSIKTLNDYDVFNVQNLVRQIIFYDYL